MKRVYFNFLTRKTMVLSALVTLCLSGVTPKMLAVTSQKQVVTQTNNIKGRVLDAAGDPIIGATVKVKGSNQTGTVTDLDGNFALNNISSGGYLVVSYIGYKTQEVSISSSPMIVTLQEDNATLNEVVVVGFGTQKKVNLTGSVSVVSGEELSARPVQNVSQALQGIVPGLQIASNTGGALDATQSINVRGTGTIGQGSSSSPLILIDGMEGDINTLNPQDIESISVLKDAAASSIYGSRAPFGVILITTKTGGSGKVTVHYNNSFRVGSLIRGKHMMNSVDFASWMNDVDYNSGNSPFFDNARMKQIVAYHNGTPSGPGQRMAADGTTLYVCHRHN